MPTESAGSILLQIGVEEGDHFVPGDDIHPVVQIHMAGVGNNHQFLIVSREFFEGIFAEIAGMGFFSMDKKYRIADFSLILQERHGHEG